MAVWETDAPPFFCLFDNKLVNVSDVCAGAARETTRQENA